MKKGIKRILGTALCLCMFAVLLSEMTAFTGETAEGGTLQGKEVIVLNEKKPLFTYEEMEEFSRWMGSLGIPQGVKKQGDKARDAGLSIKAVGDRVYVKRLKPSVSRVIIVNYLPNGGSVKLREFRESILGIDGDTAEEQWMWCAELKKGFKEGYRTSQDAVAYYKGEGLTDAEAKNLVNLICAYYYYFFKVYTRRNELYENQQFMLMQAVLWTILNEVFDWYTGNNVQAETMHGEKSKTGEWALNYYREVFTGSGREWINANRHKIEGAGEIFVGDGQNVSKWKGTYIYGKARLKKESGGAAYTGGNNAYSLKEAVYYVYDTKSGDSILSGHCGTFVTNADGDSNIVELDLEGNDSKIFYVREETSSPGHKPDTTIHELRVRKSDIAVLKIVNSVEPPEKNPFSLLLKKINAEGGPLKEAEFEIKFYPGYYESASADPGKAPINKAAERTWTFKTDESGEIEYDDAHKISGDELYKDGSEPFLPLGTITIRETKAPPGYRLNNTVYVRRIHKDDGAAVNVYNAPEVADNYIKLDLIKSVSGNDFFGTTAARDSGNASFPSTVPTASEFKVHDDIDFTPATEGTWEESQGRWKFKKSGGIYAKSEWINTAGKNRYYFDDNGFAVRGWQTIEGNIYYFPSTHDSHWMRTGWQFIDGHWYYFQQSAPYGIMLTGLATVDGHLRYFGDDGAMRTGWQTVSGNTYYFDGNGFALKDWHNVEGNKYYFGSNGVMCSGPQLLDSKLYYFNDDINKGSIGAIMTGWQKIGSDYYFFNSDTGAAYKSTWLRSSDNQYYYANTDGTLQTGDMTAADNTEYKFDPDTGALIEINGIPFRLKDAVFRHTGPDNTTEDYSTDIKGQITITGLKPGRHTIQEITPPTGFMMCGTAIPFTVGEDGSIISPQGSWPPGANAFFQFTSVNGNGLMEVNNTDAPGRAKLVKVSDDSESTGGNLLYSLAGAVYGIYIYNNNGALSGKVGTFRTKDDGVSNIVHLAVGTYYVQEEKASPGFMRNDNIYELEVTGQNTTDDTAALVNAAIGHVTEHPETECWLLKKSLNPQITDGNSVYSLKGAIYNIYRNAELTDKAGELVTKTVTAEGCISDTITLEPGTYYIQEDQGNSCGLAGYIPDPDSYEIKVSDGEIKKLEMSDTGRTAGAALILKKMACASDRQRLFTAEEAADHGLPPLSGAEFEIRFFPGYYAPSDQDPSDCDVFDSPHSPAKTWVFRTDSNGEIKYDTDHYVSGDPLYEYPAGSPALPLGTIVITETKSPDGYRINNETHVRQIGREGDDNPVTVLAEPKVKDNTVKLDIIKSRRDCVFRGYPLAEDHGNPVFPSTVPTDIEDKTSDPVNFPSYTSGEWENHHGRLKFKEDVGSYALGWTDIGGRRYWFDSEGYAVRGWQKIGGNKFYFDTDCRMQTGWQYIDGDWYYFDCSYEPKGRMLVGLCEVDGSFRYFARNNGAMRTGWQDVIFSSAGTVFGALFYFDGSGRMLTGWHNIEGFRYLFYTSEYELNRALIMKHPGVCLFINFPANIQNQYYQTTSGHAFLTGWKHNSSSPYGNIFFNSETCAAYEDTWVKSAEGQYYYAHPGSVSDSSQFAPWLETVSLTQKDPITYADILYEFDPDSGALIAIDGKPFRIEGAVFRHTKPDGTEEDLITDIKGQITINGLESGWHTIEEIGAPDGHEPISGRVKFFVGDDGSISGVDNLITESEFRITAAGDGVLEVKNTPSGKARLIKVSANTDATEGNNAYSLAGAIYKVYKNKDVVDGQIFLSGLIGQFITKEDGTTDPLALDPGLYYVREEEEYNFARIFDGYYGYYIDPQVYEVTVVKDQTTTFTVQEVPRMDPLSILIEKKEWNPETNSFAGDGDLPLARAQFEMKFYPGYFEPADSDPATIGETPARTWVFETDEDGSCQYGNTYLVDGSDPLYIGPDNQPQLPMGTITIQEIKAPEGYHLNDEVYVRRIVPHDSQLVSTYNVPVIPEKPITLTVTKSFVGGLFKGEPLAEDHGNPYFPSTLPTEPEDKSNPTIYFPPTAPGEWEEWPGGTRFRLTDGSYPTCRWENIDGSRYYFDDEGYVVRGWYADHMNIYYSDRDGKMQTGWQFINGYWYFFDENPSSNTPGRLKINWFATRESGFYGEHHFDPYMDIGWLVMDGLTYYFDGNGRRLLGGFHNIEGRRYYFAEDDGPNWVRRPYVVQTGWQDIEVDGETKRFCFSEANETKGQMFTGRKEIGGNIYFFSSETGEMYHDTWVRSAENQYYYANTDGTLQTDDMAAADNTRYTFDPDSGALIAIDGRPFRIEGVKFLYKGPGDTAGQELTTDMKGQITITRLKPGTHSIKETWAPNIYLINPTEVIFTVDEDGNISIVSDLSSNQYGHMELTVTASGDAVLDVQNQGMYRLQLWKVSSACTEDDPDELIRLKGAKLALYEDEGCTVLVGNQTSGTMGYIGFGGLETEKAYYLKETDAPPGYRIPVDDSGSPIIYEIVLRKNAGTGEYGLYVDGALVPDAVVLKEDHEAGDPNPPALPDTEFAAANFTIINPVSAKIPKTGTYAGIVIALGGLLLMGIALIASKKKKGKVGEEK